MICSFTTNIKPNADNLVIRGAIRPQLSDPSLLSTWSHRAWAACGCTMVLVSLAKSIIGAANSHIWLEPILAGLVGYVLADLGSGIYHWGIDNYCIVSGVWNGFLDKHKVFEALEMMLFLKQGVRPRSWSEPTSEWTEETESS